MPFHPTGLYQVHLGFKENISPPHHEVMMEYQPFMNRGRMKPVDHFLLAWAEDHGQWGQWLSKEQTAYALGQVTAARALPTLTEYVSIATLLDSRIHLREFLDTNLVAAVTASLSKNAEELQWKKVDWNSYVCVVGAGVAACIDTTSSDEVLYLRYSNHIAQAIALAQKETDLPRNLFGLQNNLHECIDQLLVSARRLTLKHLAP